MPGENPDAPVVDPAAVAAAAAAPAAEPVVEATPPAPEPVVEPAPEPGPAPWAKSLEAAFTDEAERARVDAYLREHQQPYITKLEQERAEAAEKAWVYDDLTGEDPAEALSRIAEELYPGLGERITELVAAGASPDEAVAQAEGETDPAAPSAELSPEVAEMVEWAKAQRAREAEAEQARTEEAEMAEAVKVLDEWKTPLLAAEPDLKESTLMAYVVSHEGDMDAAYAAYRADFPKPEGAPAPPTIGGRSNGGAEPVRAMSSLADAAGSVFDAAAGNRA